MARSTPYVRDGVLRYAVGSQEDQLSIESAEWWRWLDAPGTTSFRFQHGADGFTARRESRGSGQYWYAYRKQGRRLLKAYLGRSEQLTRERLVRCAVELAGSGRAAADTDVRSGPVWWAAIPNTASTVGGKHPELALWRDPLVATKLHPPSARSDLVRRPRLLERLEVGARGKLTLLSAPAGFGKTTLLTAWIALRQQPIAWVALDAGDNDPTRFWGYVIAALQRCWPEVGAASLAMLRAPQPLPVESILATLINELAAVSEEMMLVLDDYHVVEEQAIHDALTFLIDRLPPRAHVIVASRTDPPLPLARLRTQGELVELRAADLRFTFEEAATFLNQVMGLDLATEDVAALEARTEGWIAGLHLAALSMRGSADVEGFIAGLSGAHRYILDYLADEVLQRQSAEIQTFLLRTSILDRLTGPLCDAIVGDTAMPAASQTMLEQLERANLFVVPLDEERKWYRYHRLFADVLRDRLRRSATIDVAELHCRAAAWYEAHGLLEEAVEHALAAEDFERAGRTIERIARTVLMRGEMATLRRWLGTLPEAAVRSRPRLCTSYAWTLLMTSDLDAVDRHLRNAERLLHDGTNTGDWASDEVPAAREIEDVRAEIDVLRAISTAMRGDTARALALAEDVLHRLPLDGFLRSAAMLGLALPYELSGGLETAADLYVEAARIASAGGNIAIALLATCYAGEMRAMKGQLRQAAALYRQAQSLAAEFGSGGLLGVGLVDIGLGELLREWNDLDAAADHLARGIDRCQQLGEVMAIGGYVSLARVRQARGDTSGAIEAIAKAEQIARRESATDIARLTVEAHQVRLWLTQGNLSAAIRWADQQDPDIKDDASSVGSPRTAPYPVPELRLLTMARVRLAQGRADEAHYLLEQLLGPAETAGHLRDAVEILVLLSLAHEARGNTTEALAALERALALAEPEGYVRIFADEGEPMVRLLVKLIERHSKGRRPKVNVRSLAYVRTLLAALGHPLVSTGRRLPSRTELSLVEPLSDRELEVLRLIAAGFSNRAIAAELIVAESTAKWHVQNIYGKLGVRTRTQALNRARELGLLAP